MKIEKQTRGFLVEHQSLQYAVSTVKELQDLVGEIYTTAIDLDDPKIFKSGDLVSCEKHVKGIVFNNDTDNKLELKEYPLKVIWEFPDGMSGSDAYTLEGEWGYENAQFEDAILDSYRLRKES